MHAQSLVLVAVRTLEGVQSLLLIAGQLPALQQSHTLMMGDKSYICVAERVNVLGVKLESVLFSAFDFKQVGFQRFQNSCSADLDMSAWRKMHLPPSTKAQSL